MAEEKNTNQAAAEDKKETAKSVDSQQQNPQQEEFGGPKGLEPTRYGDWERKGRCIDF